MKKNNTFLKKLFNYFDSYLIADKGIDFLLIFVGLVAALAFENYINNKQIEGEYVQHLSRVHKELATNIPSFWEINKIFEDYENLSNDMIDGFSSGIQLIQGFDKISEVYDAKFQTNIYRSINSKDFLNNNLYSQLFGIYSRFDELEDFLLNKKSKIEDLYTTYYEISLLNSNKADYTAEAIKFNHQYDYQNTIRVENRISILEIKIEEIIKLIEAEIKLYGYDINKLYTYENYFSLSTSYFLSDINLCVKYADQGLKIIENKMKNIDDPKYENYLIYSGKLHNNIALAITSARRTGDYLKPEYSERDILFNLKEWDNSGYNKLGNKVIYADYYYSINNENMFLKYLNKIVEDDNPNWLVGKINHWKDLADKDTVYNILSNFSKKLDRSVWEYEINSDRPWSK